MLAVGEFVFFRLAVSISQADDETSAAMLAAGKAPAGNTGEQMHGLGGEAARQRNGAWHRRRDFALGTVQQDRVFSLAILWVDEHEGDFLNGFWPPVGKHQPFGGGAFIVEHAAGAR